MKKIPESIALFLKREEHGLVWGVEHFLHSGLILGEGVQFRFQSLDKLAEKDTFLQQKFTNKFPPFCVEYIKSAAIIAGGDPHPDHLPDPAFSPLIQILIRIRP